MAIHQSTLDTRQQFYTGASLSQKFNLVLGAQAGEQPMWDVEGDDRRRLQALSTRDRDSLYPRLRGAPAGLPRFTLTLREGCLGYYRWVDR